jgi:hypothetical protein
MKTRAIKMEKSQRKKQWGGARAGAGRKRKGASPALSALDLAAIKDVAPEEIDPVAQQHASMALRSLVKILVHGKAEGARISAANEILDRGYGKPAVEIGGDAAMLPFMTPPLPASTLSAEIRTEARKHAHLAIEVLRRIADTGASESARAAAAKSLLSRGLGTVAAARMADELRARPLGKKEEAAQAAVSAASGRYATPPPPRNRKDWLQ